MYKYYNALKYGKAPRWAKKKILGKRWSKTRIKAQLKKTVIGEHGKTMYDNWPIKPFAFCPNCGCREYFGTGNKTSYPDHWENFYCLRCGKLVAEIDNSPCYHVLETFND
jgi:transcription initiation factor IIE alpha subunit